MTLHFLKRDFIDFRLEWVILLIVTTLAVVVSYTPAARFSWIGLLYAYGIFAIAPLPEILGSVWRTQHHLSRHYLLSLPVPHKKLFLIQQIRLLTFCLPLMILGCLWPFLTSIGLKSFTLETWILYYFGLFISVSLLIHSMIWQTLEMERISSYLPRGERLWANIKLFVVWMGLWVIPAVAWVDLLKAGGPIYKSIHLAHVVFPAMFIVLIFLIPRNARRWCVTL